MEQDIKYKRYIQIFLINFCLYFVFFVIGFKLISSIVTLMFFGSTFFMVFSRDAKIEKFDKLVIPEVHHYQASRLNIYGYILALGFVIVSLLFYIMTAWFGIGPGLTSIILWAIFIFILNAANRTSDEYQFTYAIYDYLWLYISADDTINLHESQVWNISTVFSKFKSVEENKVKVRASLKKLNIELEKSIFDRLGKIYDEYVERITNQESELISDEIEAMNEEGGES